jgi:hypothetical protein
MSPFVSREDGTALKNDFYVLREEVDKAVDTFNDLVSVEALRMFLNI